jgi:outer membrane protein assembly factor BamB
MENYSHYRFNPQRRRLERDRLAPPLKLLEDWTMQDVGYPPKIALGKVFVSFLEGRLAAFEENSAKKLWDFRLPVAYESGVPNDGELLISDGTLVTRLGGEIFVLDSATGKLLYRHAAPNFDLRSAALFEKRLFGIYLDEEDDEEPVYCFAYDLEGHEILWKHELARLAKSLTVSARAVFLSDKKGYFTCLSAETGAQIWTTSLQEIGKYTETDKTIRSGDLTGVPFLWDDLVVLPVAGYHVVALDQTSGALRWSQSVDIDDPRNVVCSPDGVLAVVDSEVYDTIDVATGRILSRMNIAAILGPYDDPFLTQMDVTDRFIYFSIINRGILVAQERQTGQISWTYQCAAGIPVLNAPVVMNGHLYLLDEDHRLYGFAEE